MQPVTKINVVVWNENDPNEPPNEFTHGQVFTLPGLDTEQKNELMRALREFLCERYITVS